MKKLKQETKKKILRIVMLALAVLMILSFVMLPAAQTVSADEEGVSVAVAGFDTGKLNEAIETAKEGADLNLITSLAVSGGTLSSDDYSAICGYPNIKYLELAGCDTLDGKIPDNALSSRNQLTYVSLPANTSEIGSRAFSGNRALLKVSIPSTVRHIGEYAFEGCEKVEEFTFPAEVETIGAGAFYDCKALKEFALPEAVCVIPESCFGKCSLTELHLGPQVTEIRNNAFADCHTLTDIYFYSRTAPNAPENAFQNLKVTIHTYEDSEGFESLSSNFVSIAYDLSEDSVYIPPKSAGAESGAAETNADTAAKEETATVSETTRENSDEAVPEPETIAETSAPAQTGFSTASVVIIAVLCAAVGVLAALLAVKSRKK